MYINGQNTQKEPYNNTPRCVHEGTKLGYVFAYLLKGEMCREIQCTVNTIPLCERRYPILISLKFK